MLQPLWVRGQSRLRGGVVVVFLLAKNGFVVPCCHHAEMNVICNCAASGVPTKGAWLVVTGEPCMMCAKLIHHAGITKVIVVGGGYAGENGVEYLRENVVDVVTVKGPQDPRVPRARP